MPAVTPIPRKKLATALKPILPKTWRIVDDTAAVPDLDEIIVQLKQLNITRAPSAPTAVHAIEFVATITAGQRGVQAVEDSLDASVVQLLHALDELSIAWTTATKVVDDNRLGYDITLTITSQSK